MSIALWLIFIGCGVCCYTSRTSRDAWGWFFAGLVSLAVVIAYYVAN